MVLVREISAGYRGLPADGFYCMSLKPPRVYRERTATHSRDVDEAAAGDCRVCARSASGNSAIREMDALLPPATNLTQTLRLQLSKTLDL
jgi:hypothetical protein